MPHRELKWEIPGEYSDDTMSSEESITTLSFGSAKKPQKRNEVGLMEADFSKLVRLTESHIEPATETLAQAFHDYPSFIYALPDASERRQKSPHLSQFSVHFGILCGEVYATSLNLEGVAVWLPSPIADSAASQAISSLLPSLEQNLGRDVLDRLSYLVGHIDGVQQRHAPSRYWHLDSIGVKPAYQGRGYASTLLKPMLARIEQEHLPCYLNTQKEENIAIYQRYGFEVVEDIAVPGTGIRTWGMLRENPS